MKYQVLQNKSQKDSNEAFHARLYGYVDPAMFLKNYQIVCEIEADDLNDVFEIGNIGPEEKITRIDRMHSISVGDVIRTPEGVCHVVESFGFGRLGEQTLMNEAV
jgi:hypothetical protein